MIPGVLAANRRRGFATGVTANARYWRLLVRGNENVDGQLNTIQIHELMFMTSAGAGAQPTTGTASASGTSGGSNVANAFDGNTGTTWASDLSSSQLNKWIKFSFATAQTITHVSIRGNTWAGPRSFYIQYSPDDINWTTACFCRALPWNTNTLQVFAIASERLALDYSDLDEVGGHRFWAIRVKATPNSYYNSTPITLTDFCLKKGGVINDSDFLRMEGTGISAISTMPFWVPRKNSTDDYFSISGVGTYIAMDYGNKRKFHSVGIKPRVTFNYQGLCHFEVLAGDIDLNPSNMSVVATINDYGNSTPPGNAFRDFFIAFNFNYVPSYYHVGSAYSVTPTVTLAAGAVTYSLASGTLPPGLSLNTSTGEISGTPTTGGLYTGISISGNDGVETFTTSTFTIGGGAFHPNDIGALAGYDFADVSSVTVSGGAITAMADKSGNGKTLTGNSTLAYIYPQAYASLAGAGRFTATGMPTTYELFASGKPNTNTDWRTLLHHTTAGMHAVIVQTGGHALGLYDGSFKQASGKTWPVDTYGQIHVIMTSPTSISMGRDGDTPGAVTTPNLTANSSMTIMNVVGTGGTQGFGYVDALWFMPVGLSSGDRAKMQGYLAWRAKALGIYDGVALLGGGHTYKSAPP